MNCPKCHWPGLIGGSLKKRIAELEASERIRIEDNAHLRGEMVAVRALLLRARALGPNSAAAIDAALELLA